MIFVYEVGGKLYITKEKQVTCIPVGDDRELVDKVLKKLEKQGNVKYLNYQEQLSQ